MKVSDLQQDSRNANKGSAKGQKAIVGSMQRSKLGRSVVVDKRNRLIAGNKTTEAVAEVLGVDADVIVVESEGDKLIVHKRTDLDLDDPDPNNPARQLAYADNVTSFFSFELDPEVVMADLEAGFDFDEIDVSLEDLGDMMEEGVSELLSQSPDFQPVGADEQPRLDRKEPVICPHCGENIHDEPETGIGS